MQFPYFQFLKGTKFERSASLYFFIIGLSALLFACSSFQIFKKKTINFSNFDGFATNYLATPTPASVEEDWPSKSETTTNIPLFNFDPNTATKKDFEQLGLSPKIVRTIDNFRKKNGKFYKSTDLKKIYGFKAKDYQRLEKFIKIKKHKRLKEKHVNPKQPTDNQSIENLFKFNPNEASVEELVQLGIPKKLSQRIENYRQKGGKFYKKEDLKKIYGFPDALYEKLEDYIVLPTKEQPLKHEKFSASFSRKKAHHSTVVIDINQSNSADWEQLRGIGPGYAKRILNFRNKLGGFSSIEQVGNTYNFPDSVFQTIIPFLKISPIVTFISINEVTEEDLKKHPYFSWKQARAVIRYKKQHGNYKDLEDLKKILGVFKAKDWERIAPYLKF